MTDYKALKALCAELTDDLEEWVEGYFVQQSPRRMHRASFERIDRARAALAAEPVPPTDEELEDTWDKEAGYYALYGEAKKYARSVLARWGQ